MTSEIIILGSIALLTQYIFAVLILRHFQGVLNNALVKVSSALKSPKNRSQIDQTIESLSHDRKLAFVWPYLMIKQMRDESQQRK